MSIGEKFATRNEVEALRRKLELAITGKGIFQSITNVASPAQQFICLTDVPQSYAAASNFVTRVKSTVDELEFAELKGTTNQVYLTPHAADYVFSLPQDIHTAATPTFAGLYLESSTIAPFLKITNESNTERDPIIQFAVGATPITKFTAGVDDSDDDKWKLAVGDGLGLGQDTIVVSSEGGMAGTAEFTLIDTFATAVKMRGVCTDGTYIYCVSGEYGNTKIYKHDITDGVLLNTSSDTNGAGNGGRCATDGIHVYVLCTSYVKKYLCTDLSYVASSDSWSGVSYTGGIYYWAGHVYISNVSDFNIRKIRCSDMGTVWTTTFTQGAGASQTNTARGVATDGQFVYIQDCEVNNRIVRLNMDGTWYDATDVVKPLDYFYFAPWCAGDYLYDMAEYAAGDYYVEKRNKSDLSISETFNILNNVTQGCRWGDYHYLVSVESTGIYKYQYATSGGSAPAKIWFRLKDAYGQFVDVATLTADVRLGVGTTIPSETIEGVGNIKAQAGQFISTIATGTAPVVVSSTTVCTNLNAGLVDGYHHDQSLLIAASPTFVALNLSATSNQIVLQSAGVTGTITATPASSNKVWTLQDVTGTIYQTAGTDVAVADGGTGKSSFTQYAIPYASAATTIGEIAIGTAGQVLAVNGGANGYTWAAALSNPMTDIGDMIIGGAAGAPAKLADVAVGSYLRSGGVTTAPLWSTLTLPNTGTAYRLPVFSATNVMTELAAVGATGEYLKGNTGAIPSWATLNQAAVAGLTTADSPQFTTITGVKLTGYGGGSFYTYSATLAQASAFALYKSHSNTEVLTRTLDTEYIGIIQFAGVNATPALANAINIIAVQNGATGTYVPADLRFQTYDASAAHYSLTLTTSGGVHVGGTSDIADNNIYIDGDCSALTFTDRTPFPKDKKEAYDAVLSLTGKDGQLDHDKLHAFIKSGDGRNLSALVSAQNEVIKDLLARIEALEKK